MSNFNWRKIDLLSRKIILTLSLVVLCFASAQRDAWAQRKLNLIRDAEIENTIRDYATPLLQSAGLSPEALSIHLVNDKSLNAFVAGGQRLFLHSGLLIRAENANQVIGVIAHEIGHIQGGHLITRFEKIKEAQNQSVLAMLLGAATAIATSRPDVGVAVMTGTQSAAGANVMGFTRGQESAADQAGVRLLDATKQSSKGLGEFLDILGDQEILLPAQQDPYVRTHPLTRQRVSFVHNHISHSMHSEAQSSAAQEAAHARTQAKLMAFLEPTSRTLHQYPPSDTSVPARYARAIANYRRADMVKALPELNALVTEFPNDPYFHELKGQALFENGRLAEALPAYRRSVELSPTTALFRISLAQVIIELGRPELLEEAQRNLEVAVTQERNNPFARKLLGMAYGKAGNNGMASLALAEHALMIGKKADAIYHAGRAEKLLKQGTSSWLRVQDVKNAAGG